MRESPFRLAVVCRNLGDKGGAEEFARHLAEGVATDPRWEVHVFSSFPYRAPAAIRFHPLPQPRSPRFLQKTHFAHLAARALARESWDLIHTHEPLPGAHLVTYGTPHEYWVRQVRRRKWLSLYDRLTMRLERLMFHHPHCRTILPMSELVRDTLVAAYPALPSKWEVVTPGIDLADYTGMDRVALRAGLRRQHGLTERDFVLLFVGNNYEHKGLSRIIAAMAQTPELSHRLWVVGRGKAPPYQRQARQSGIAHRLHFFGLQRESLLPFYAAADALVLPSAFETFGMVVLEAMAMGLPVIVSSNVGAGSLVKSGQNGYQLTEPITATQLAQTFRQLSQEDDLESFRESARNEAKKHTRQISLEKIMAIYEKALAKS